MTTNKETGRLVSHNPLMDEVNDVLRASPLALAGIAERAGIHQNTLQNWLRGDVFMPRKLYPVLEVLGYEVTLRKKSGHH